MGEFVGKAPERRNWWKAGKNAVLSAAGGAGVALLAPHLVPASPVNPADVLRPAALTSTVLGTPNGSNPDVITITGMDHGQLTDRMQIQVYDSAQKAKVAGATDAILGGLRQQLGIGAPSEPVTRVDVTALIAKDTDGNKGEIKVEEKAWLKGYDGANAAPAVYITERLSETNAGIVVAEVAVHADVNRQGELAGALMGQPMSRTALLDTAKGFSETRAINEKGEPEVDNSGLQAPVWTVGGRGTDVLGTNKLDLTVPGKPNTLLQFPVNEELTNSGGLTATIVERKPLSEVKGDASKLFGRVWQGITDNNGRRVAA